MTFDIFKSDQVSIFKKNGDEYTNVKATVSDETIVISIPEKDKFNIEVGDIIERVLPTGGIEKYDVLNPKFYHGIASIPQHYQIEVKKRGVQEKSSAITHINVNGNHNRINQNSIDQSQNIFNNHADISRYISDIRHEIDNLKEASDSEKKGYLEMLEQVDMSCSSSNKSKNVITTLLNALPPTAKIVSSISTILSTLFP